MATTGRERNDILVRKMEKARFDALSGLLALGTDTFRHQDRGSHQGEEDQWWSLDVYVVVVVLAYYFDHDRTDKNELFRNTHGWKGDNSTYTSIHEDRGALRDAYIHFEFGEHRLDRDDLPTVVLPPAGQHTQWYLQNKAIRMSYTDRRRMFFSLLP